MKLTKRYFNNLELVDNSGVPYCLKSENTNLSVEEWLVESMQELAEESEIEEDGIKEFITITLRDIALLQSLDMEQKEVFGSNIDRVAFSNLLKRIGKALDVIYK